MGQERKDSGDFVEDYPRKQMRRKNWTSLNGDWDFMFDDFHQHEIPNSISKWPLKIKVPFAPESKASGIGDQSYHPRCWYRREFSCERKSGRRVFLHFGAVDYSARVWLNNQFLGCHEGGHTPFSFDITNMLRDDGTQTLVVCADDDPFDLAKPRGKQDWLPEPHSIWYPRTSGIWQTVWMEEVNSVHIDRLNWTPLLERWEIGCEAFVSGLADPSATGLELKIRLTCGGKLLVQDTYAVINREVHRRIALSDPGIDDFRNEMLWSPEKPTLIDARVELYLNGQLVDEIDSYTALRSVQVHGGRFLLNGRPYYLRMVLDQGYWPDTLMTPPSTDALKKDIELVKAAGFNGVRKHQKIEVPDFLYWADVMGLLVSTEMPSAYRFTHEAVERLTREWIDVIDRDLNHPCIVLWVPFNESWGVPDLAEKAAHQSCVQALYHLTRTMDPTRPVIGNDGWESVATDILGIHDYDDHPERLAYKYHTKDNLADALSKFRPGGRVLTVEGYPHNGQPVMLTEFGGIACKADGDSGNEWGYSMSRSPQELRNRYEGLLKAVHQIDLFCGFCYTQFTDTFQEANGLFTADRKPKFSINSMMRATRGGGYTRGELISAPQPPPLPAPDDESPSHA